MKRLLLAFCLLFSVPLIQAKDSDIYDIFYSSITSANQAGTVSLNIGYPDKGVQQCITKLTFQANNFPAAGTTLSILDGTVTKYKVTFTTFTAPFIDSWDYQNAKCLSPGVTSYVTISSGTFNLDVTGFARKRRE